MQMIPVTYKGLNVRRSRRNLFLDGDYIPLQTRGQRQEHICAFGRHKGGAWVLVVVPRLLTKLVRVGTIPVGREVWGNDALLLPEGTPEHWLNIFTGENLEVVDIKNELPLFDILRMFPIALLIGI